MSDPTLTERLVALIAAKEVTEADLTAAGLLVLDAVANAIAGQATVPGRLVLDWQKETQARSARDRAFVLGALTHILETDDLHRASIVHPGCVVVPAAWALAEREGASGRALLIAVLAGFEAACRVGMAVGPAHYRIWHNTATCGPYGAAVAAAALMDLSEEQVVNALGNAGTQSSGLWQFLDTGAMTKHLHAGRAADAGVLAADLARRGFTGPPAILEGPKGFFAAACPDADPDAVLREPNSPWQAHLTSIKPWPCCRHTHPAIDAAISLRQMIGGAPIARLRVETYAAALDVCDRMDPYTDYEAKFSLQHAVAAALTRDVDFDAFGDEARRDLAGIRRVTSLAVSEPYKSAYPVHWGARVEATLVGGRAVEATRTDAKGDPEAPLSRDEMIEKARMLMRFGGVSEPDGVIAAILNLPQARTLPRLPGL